MNRRDFNKLAVSVPFVSGIFFNEKNTDRALTPIVLQEVADKHLPAQNKNKDYDFNNEDWQYLCGECLAKEIETEQEDQLAIATMQGQVQQAMQQPAQDAQMAQQQQQMAMQQQAAPAQNDQNAQSAQDDGQDDGQNEDQKSDQSKAQSAKQDKQPNSKVTKLKTGTWPN